MSAAPNTAPGGQQLIQSLEQANQAASRGDLGTAANIYSTLVQQFPGSAPAWFGFGQIQARLGRAREAVAAMEKAVQQDKRNPLYLSNLGEFLRQSGNPKAARKHAEKVTRLRPDEPGAWFNLARVEEDLDHEEKAEQLYQKALRINPKFGIAWNNLGALKARNGRREAAAGAYRKAAELADDNPSALTNFASVLIESGQLDEAKAWLTRALSLDADFGPAHLKLAGIERFHDQHPHLATLERLYHERARLSLESQTAIEFAWGKAMDDCGEYAAAFKAFSSANHRRRREFEFDIAQHRQSVDALIAATPRSWVATYTGVGPESDLPIFILGMPRSGTTLTEQIVSSHPEVVGAGELAHLSVVLQTSPAHPTPRPEDIDGTRIWLRNVGETYLKRLRRADAKAHRITDKMPGNFRFLGAIHVALPGARIVHLNRHIADVAVSCFVQNFAEGHAWTYDLGELGGYCAEYLRLMEHWRDVLPEQSFLDFSYESLVADPETEVRSLLGYLNLDWDPACLAFHENKRKVATASYAQVRQPMYQGSVARWKRYEAHLGPFFEGLGDWADRMR